MSLEEKAPQESPPEPAPRPGLGAARIVVGILLIVAGGGWLLDALGVVRFDWGVFFAAALISTGLSIMLFGNRGSRGGLIALGAVLTLLLTVMSASPLLLSDTAPLRVGGGAMERVERPRTPAELEDYRLQMGSLTIDLTALDLPRGNTRVSAEMGLGELVVVVPREVPLEVRANVRAGEIDILGSRRSGIRVSERFTSPRFGRAPSTLSLDLIVRLGSIEVRHVR